MRHRSRDGTSDFTEKYGPVGVVTGSARGIGAGFARTLAGRGIDLILTDVDVEGLNDTADEIRARTSRTVRTFPVDMRSADAARELDHFTAADDVGLVICNHLFPGGQWQVLDTDLEHLHEQLDANVRAYLDLVHTFGRRLRERGRGGLILMSSLTAVVGSPYVTTYGASKAFILAFGSGVGFELRSSGVDVLTLVPSSVNTETYRRSAKTPSRIFPPMDVRQFVELGLAQLGKRWVAVPGARNVLIASLLTRMLPRQIATSTMGRNMESMLGMR